MGNCFGNGKGLVHPVVVQPFQPEVMMAPRGSSQIKVRMTVRELRELVRRAESRKCDDSAAVEIGMLIMEGVRQGRWEAVGVGGGGGSGGNRGINASPLETIHED